MGHSVCLAAHVSGGLKSHSTRGPGSISKSGGNASLAGRQEGMEHSTRARRRKLDTAKRNLEPPDNSFRRAGRLP